MSRGEAAVTATTLDLDSYLLQLPKVDLHCHLLGTVQAKTFGELARRAGLPTLYLGADVPLDAWSEAVAKTPARGVVTVAPRRRDATRVGQLAGRLEADHPGLPVWVGGRYQHLAPPPSRPLGHDIGEAVTKLAALPLD